MLGVNQGSEKPPRLIILEYKGGGKEKPIVDGKAGRDALDLAIKIHDLIIEDIH